MEGARWFHAAARWGASCALAGSLCEAADAASRIMDNVPAPPLIADVYDVGYLEADCSYHGVHCATDGLIYFSLSSHSIGNWMRIYRFNPDTEALAPFWSPLATTPDAGHVVQGKVHSPLRNRCSTSLRSSTTCRIRTGARA